MEVTTEHIQTKQQLAGIQETVRAGGPGLISAGEAVSLVFRGFSVTPRFDRPIRCV